MTDLKAMIRAVVVVSGCNDQEAPEVAALVLRIALGSLPSLPRPPWYRSKGAYRQRLADRVARRAYATSAPPTTGAPTWGPTIPSHH